MHSQKPPSTYGVFLNFRGEDTRNNFTGHLYASLSNAGIYTYRDSENFHGGCDMDESLLKAIEESRLSIVVFSERYTESSWCLDELVKIMECRKMNGQIVLPLFYHVDPSDIRRQSEKLLPRFTKRAPHTIMAWRDAIREAANIAGFHVDGSRNEAEIIELIVEEVLRILDDDYIVIADYPVGIESRVHELLRLVKIGLDHVGVIGIWGMGGIGKTTIAKATYNEIHHNFEGKCFVPDVKDVWRQLDGPVHLQKQLLASMLKTKKINIQSFAHGRLSLMERLRSKRVLLVLDDVDDLEQVQELCGDRKWFGLGSRIIITTRDIHILNFLKADVVYSPIEMDNNESLKLFKWYAFKEENIIDEQFIQLSREAVRYCGGLPLALQVIGSYLFNRDITQWQSTLEKLKEFPMIKS